MSPPDDLYQEIESYLGFLIDHDLDDAYEADPINRTLAENKSAFARAAAAGAQKGASVGQASNVTQLRTPNLLAPTPPAGQPFRDLASCVAEARQRATDAQTLDALYAAIDGFESCAARHEGGRAIVRGRGSDTSDLLVIGESPDADEDLSGQAFAGKPGRMVDLALAAAGFGDRSYLTGCAFWRAAGGRPLTADDMALNAPFLHGLVRLLKPKAILLLGSAATSTVLNVDQPLRALRGRIVAYTQGGANIPSLASYPPAFLLRQPQAKAMLWQDLLTLTAPLVNTL